MLLSDNSVVGRYEAAFTFNEVHTRVGVLRRSEEESLISSR